MRSPDNRSLLAECENYGAEVNLFVDYSQIVQLERLRGGIRKTKSLLGQGAAYKE